MYWDCILKMLFLFVREVLVDAKVFKKKAIWYIKVEKMNERLFFFKNCIIKSLNIVIPN